MGTCVPLPPSEVVRARYFGVAQPRRSAHSVFWRRSTPSHGARPERRTWGKGGQAMTVTVCMDETGAIWIANGQGAILAECFFKTEDETTFHRM